MAQFKNVMEVFKLLDNSNCRKCNKQTCLAFAGAVFQGQAVLSECPRLSADIIEKYGDRKNTFRQEQEQENLTIIEELRAQVAACDLEKRAGILGDPYKNGRITLKILGKPFSVDTTGAVFTDIHVNSWVLVPVYHYILSSKGRLPVERWVPLRELPSGEDWYRFFEHRCERSVKKIADTHPMFFENIIRLFNGREVSPHYDADISLVIHPLPRLPVLICYQHPEEGLDSSLHLFFDETAEDNLPISSIYSLVAGMAFMFEKLALTHA